MKQIRIRILLCAFLLTGTPSALPSGQQTITPSAFDSIYRKGISEVNANPEIARLCLERLENQIHDLTPVQKAKTSYLRLKIIQADPSLVAALENRLFTAPDSLGHHEALVYSATRYLERSMPDKAIPLLMEALETDSSLNWKTLCTIHLCEAYREKQEYEKGSAMLYDILLKKNRISDVNYAFACNRLAAIYNEWSHPAASYPDSVIKYSIICIALSQKTGSHSNLALSQNELSNQYLLKKQYSRSLELSRQAVSNFTSQGMRYDAINALINQINIHNGLKEYGHALQAAVEALNLCSLEENRNLYRRLYLQFAQVYYLLGHFREAFDFLSISRHLQEDFFKDRIDMQINEQSARYDLLLKEQKIKEEQQKSEFRRRQVLLLIIILIVLFLVSLLSIFLLRARRKEFIKQKLIEAVVETEASERQRIARDLHDGLGPVLSAVNLYFQAYVDADDTDKPSIRQKLQRVISDAIDDVSRIAHNISPHVLENYGLNTALKNFISSLTGNDKIHVDFKADFHERLERNKELTLYRCITELLNNTIKHADASRINLYIHHNDKILHIRYTDNGIGFDPTFNKSDGMGLYNMKNRVETLGGRLSIENSPGRGILVIMDVPLL